MFLGILPDASYVQRRLSVSFKVSYVIQGLVLGQIDAGGAGRCTTSAARSLPGSWDADRQVYTVTGTTTHTGTQKTAASMHASEEEPGCTLTSKAPQPT